MVQLACIFPQVVEEQVKVSSTTLSEVAVLWRDVAYIPCNQQCS
jgi:hypothetical protein